MRTRAVSAILGVLSLLACSGEAPPPPATTPAPPPHATGDFGDDLAFLQKHTEVILLGAPGPALVAVCPAYQGRVMTSTAEGETGRSFGWVNRALIQSGQVQTHMNAYGGEDRIWLGPEGGQFSVFFEKGATFEVASWQTPKSLDTEPFTVAQKSDTAVSFHQPITLANYTGTSFQLEVDRVVELLDATRAAERLGTRLGPSVKTVAFESRNTLRNVGAEAWKKDTGLLSVWILGMFNPSPEAIAIVPFRDDPALGPGVTTDYFGEIPADRLALKDGVAYFKADGRYRSKIGIPRPRALPVLGAYDASSKVLTIVQYDLPEDAKDYVDSRWRIHEAPYAGDVVNSYNDGPLADGTLLGPFWELETSSPAAALEPGQSLTHTHRTFHLVGDPADLGALCQTVLGVSLDQVAAAFAR
jgi:hypothetical protein